MIINLNKAILHILDFHSGITVFSEQELNLDSESVATFLRKHIEKSFSDSGAQSGSFLDNSTFNKQLTEYVSDTLNLIEFSTYIANLMHASVAKSDKLHSMDLLVCDFSVDTVRYVCILECAHRPAFTHQVSNDQDGIHNDIVNHHAILPSITQKLDAYAFINVETSSIKFVDKKRLVDGEEAFILPDVVLECSTVMSPKSTVKLMNSIAQKVAENHGQSSVFAISKAKNLVMENLETSDRIEPEELGKEIFESSAIMQKEFVEEIKNAGIPDTVVMIDKSYAIRTNKNHKIKTDTGIEISIPADYYQNTEYIEFINNTDGTLSIQLKNIGRISNK